MKSKKLIITILLLMFFNNVFSQATGFVEIIGAPTLEAQGMTTWLSILDQLYAQYDQTMKTITMIEQNYEQMAFYIERAKNFNFKEIRWDGDLDFRNEIMDATKQVNRQLTNIRRVKESFERSNIEVNGQSFSLKDLCNLQGGEQSLLGFTQAAMNEVDNTFEKVAKTYEEGLTNEEAAYLWSRYGLSPKNYYMVKAAETKASDTLAEVIGWAEEELQQQKDEEFYKTLEQVMYMLQTDESMTESELAQVNSMLQKLEIDSLKDLQKSLEHGFSFLAWQLTQQEQQKRAEEDSLKQSMQELEKKKLPASF